MENVLGLAVVHRDHVSSVDGSTMELTDEVSRILKVVPRSQVKMHMEESDDENHETIQTLWKFGPSDDGAEDVCHHCHHCGHIKQ